MMKTNNKLKSRIGFTIVEVMVAAVIMTMVFAGAFSALSQSYTAIQNTRKETRATQVAQSQVEIIRTYNWTMLTNKKDHLDGASYKPTCDSSFTAGDADDYNCQFTVTPLDTSTIDANTQKIQVELSITWKNTGGNEVSHKTSTIFTKKGLNDYFTTCLSAY